MPKQEKKRSDNFFSVDELHQFPEIVRGEESYKDYALFRLLAYSGLRKGELYSLRWSDIDFDQQLLSVSKNIGRIKGKAVEKSTKNKFSETVSILKQWQKISQREKGSMSVAPLLSDGYIFTFVNRQGELEPLYQDYINNILK